VSLPGIEPQFLGHPVCSLLSIVTELYSSLLEYVDINILIGGVVFAMNASVDAAIVKHNSMGRQKRIFVVLGSLLCVVVHRICFQFHFVEPVGSSVPKFSSVAKTQGLEAKSNQSFTLLCPAQGYPVPAYRSVSGSLLFIQFVAWLMIAFRSNNAV
jgi:hypothetical protein